MKDQCRSPKIVRVEWGHIEVDGFDAPFRDVRVYPGGASEWDWRTTGTGHSPGVLPADVQDVLALGITTLVVGKGQFGRLGVHPETAAAIEQQGVTLIAMHTGPAVERYNQLAESEPVAGLFHTTC
jgi:hypothetical protein